MDTVNLESLVDEHLSLAHEQPAGRHAITLMGDHEHDLRQTLIAIAAGNRLNEHDSPGEATLQILRGEVVFTVGNTELTMRAGDYLVIPLERHGLTAITDCAVLLTVATRGER
ncbi:cupin domain-containing protein [Demequina sp. SO4-13]|uniref:cupin domain-containing protein n=1 Tax=Demequina sp. SO4-13 TaxID=3401027 RepID=UPI003AF85CE1